MDEQKYSTLNKIPVKRPEIAGVEESRWRNVKLTHESEGKAGPYRRKIVDDHQRGIVRDVTDTDDDHYHHNDQEVRHVGPRNLSASSHWERLYHFRTGVPPVKREVPAMEMTIADRLRIGATGTDPYNQRRKKDAKMRPVQVQSWDAYERDYHAKLKFMTRPTLNLSKKKDTEGTHYTHLS